eukprot:TRINITY_DN313_c0_g1_i1.p1 TRINITY_DN313_c0_g1~~TRINITY_DN313_c0_g1_i1.p1  ORF type:complete len:482 (+),score=162.87 TRINITY_DN313_c0_g1_i1:62-1447(+)
MASFSRKNHAKPLSRDEVERIKPENVHEVLSRNILVDGFDVVYDLDKSHGMYMHDARTGKEYLDLFSMFASWPISHNHPKLKDPKFLHGLTKAAAVNPANSDIYTVEMAQFVATFERVAMPKEFTHLFLVQGGGLAVENALKTAFDWKVRKNIAAGKGERGKKALHFKEAFHGRTGYTMALTNTADPKKWMYFPLFDWPRVENPKALFPLTGDNLAKTIAAEERSLQQIVSYLEKEGDDIACIILEPVQGEGGDNHFRPEFWQALRRLADKYDVLLIADEVQAGMGLSGKFWSHEHYGVTPDIVTFGKKSQVCGLIATSRVDTVPDNVFVCSSRINSTWGGNLVDMVRSRKFLEIIEEDRLVENSAAVGAYLVEKLQALAKASNGRLDNIRGKGLLVAFDLPSGADCDRLRSLAYERGVLLIGCGTRTIRFRPFLDITKGHIDTAIKVLGESLAVMSGSKL